MRAIVLLNRAAGAVVSGDLTPDSVAAAFAAAGVEAEVPLIPPGGMDARAKAAAREGYDAVVAAGGDGTVRCVAAALADSGTPLGVLPLGTLNHFAKDLGIPLKLADAVRTLAKGQVKEVDVGEVNGRVFINNSSLGLYPEIVRERELQQLHLGKSKWRALASATLHATEGRPGMAVRVDADGDQQVRRTPFVFIGNNRYTMEGLAIGARESLQGGELSLYLGRRRGRLALVQMAVRALAKRLRQDEDFELVTGDAFVISTTDRRIRVATDGEVCMMDTPLHYRIRPRALRVLVPAATEA